MDNRQNSTNINWFPRPGVKLTSKMQYIKAEFYG